MHIRKRIDYVPYFNSKVKEVPWDARSQWPCNWISPKDANATSQVTAYRVFFTLKKADTVRIHVSADERYEIYVDGIVTGRGSERGDVNNWYFETYDLELEAGEHIIVACTWSLGRSRPDAQISIYQGFILSPEDSKYLGIIGTGAAPWEVKQLAGYEFIECGVGTFATGSNIIIDGERFSWGFEKGHGDGWELPLIREKGSNDYGMYHIIDGIRYMKPGTLPSMYERNIDTCKIKFIEKLASLDTDCIPVNCENNIFTEVVEFKKLVDRGTVTIPPYTRLRVIIDLENYYCAYPKIITSGGKYSFIRIKWAEALYDSPDKSNNYKSDRDVIENKYLRGKWDAFKPDGGKGRVFKTLWWSSGRYIEMAVETDNEPLDIESFELLETRYPLSMESKIECNEVHLLNALDKCLRSLQMCAHETYMDCPYYEQVMYVGDTRLQALATYVSTTDNLLPKKALQLFAASSINHTGMVNCAYPAFNQKIIPSFCLWWICMVHDYALWRGEQSFIKSLMPIVRSQIDKFYMNINKDGLIETPMGWNFVDWANEGDNILYDDGMHWNYGVPNDGGAGVNSILNWQMVMTLAKTAKLEEYVGEPELACRAKRRAEELTLRITDMFWDEHKGMFSDDLRHRCYSEHAQCLALLSGFLDSGRSAIVVNSLLESDDLVKTSIFFKHYFFETLCKYNHIDRLFIELKPWLEMDKEGLHTTPEVFSSTTRSDCHGWGAHPLYHYFASILGIRPGSMGFESVVIRPQLGPLCDAKGVMVHPKGNISVAFTRRVDTLKANIKLPKDLRGVFVVENNEYDIVPGSQKFQLKLKYGTGKQVAVIKAREEN